MVKLNFTKGFIFCLLSLFPSMLFAQKYEAEKMVLSGNAEVKYLGSASGGAYVDMKEGDISFSVQAPSAGSYNVKIVYSQIFDANKDQNLVANGTKVVSFPRTGTGTSPVFSEVNTSVTLVAGANSIAITKNWGWIDVDYIEIPNTNEGPVIVTPPSCEVDLVTPNPTENAAKLYLFLQENYKKKIISGVMTNAGSSPTDLFNHEEIKYVRNASGKYPALVGFDFMHSTGKGYTGAWFTSRSKAQVSMAAEIWEAGGIPIFCWHWKDPSQNIDGFATSDFDLGAAFTNSNYTDWNTGSSAYQAIIKDIDIVSGLLKQLQDKGVAVMWRPLHEASGKWFWWGAKGATACKALYRLMFDRMVNHHGLRNLIWVWTSENSTDDFNNWYPGDKYVDMLGRDYYAGYNVNHTSHIAEFNKLQNAYPKKMVALTENGSVPYPDNLKADKAYWSSFMSWYGEFTIPGGGKQYNTDDDWKKIMNDPYVITLSGMPDWKKYNPCQQTEVQDNRVVQAMVYPTKVKDAVYVVCPDTRYSIAVTDVGGRLLSFISASGDTTISCSGWDSGIYYISVITENGKKTFPIIK